MLVFSATIVVVSYILSPFSLHEFRLQRIYLTNTRQHSVKADTGKSASVLAFVGYLFSAVQ